jgi:hypothetical protein
LDALKGRGQAFRLDPVRGLIAGEDFFRKKVKHKLKITGAQNASKESKYEEKTDRHVPT